ncbi:hypothetical protein N5T90_08805 [Aliarcobacter cryaerophilus]|uniref:hypothetical protein n=1 Tax=Aliarcobacter cryaerophilus TaxID=28198 RepID=UPI0021B6897D|nr:hypothetical protein [Aliarcobacter cryaerophilus]MCT7470973.1 hypothetical protein [Aliarcobacter cryaerophilus]
MKKIVLGLVCVMSFSFATTEETKELVNFLGFTGVSVSLDLAVFVTIILTLITWKITKDKERNELKEKYKDSARKSLLKYLKKLRNITTKLIDFGNQYTSVSDKLSDEQKIELQSKNAHLITEYQKDLMEFLFISPIYSKKLYEILKDSKDDFEFAQKNGSIEIVVFSSVKTMGKLLVEYTEEEIANDLTKSIYGLTIEEAEKKLQEFKNHFERK